MHIGIVSYPMLFQRDPAVQLQIRETTRALNALKRHRGFDLAVEPVDPRRARLDRYDLIHAFSSGGANHRIVEAAAQLGVPVVLSPLMPPGWDRAGGEYARQAGRGLARQSAWSAQSSYAQTRRALQLASAVVALDDSEKRAIEEGFLIDGAKVRVLPSGVSEQMFRADGDLFRLRTGMRGPFVLMDGPISPCQNQLGMAQALAALALPFVLLGDTGECDQDCLRQARAVRGVTCLGGLKHDAKMLASAYAAATVLVLHSREGACARAVLDALAAGTPVVVSAARPIDIPDSAFALAQVGWDDGAARQKAVLRLIAAPPPRDSVRRLVRPFTWERAAAQIAACYTELVTSGRALSA